VKPDIDDPTSSWRKGHLSMLVIYQSPRDYPDKIVGRWHHIRPGGTSIDLDPAFVVDALTEARAEIPPGLHNLGRKPEDDPVIVEVWI
jgi:hypothetical protein